MLNSESVRKEFQECNILWNTFTNIVTSGQDYHFNQEVFCQHCKKYLHGIFKIPFPYTGNGTYNITGAKPGVCVPLIVFRGGLELFERPGQDTAAYD